jgi:ABC-2 type transport system ATP-binding protein
MTVSAIVLDHLSKHFSGTIAVDNVSLSVPRGTIYGFLGPNGAGKTTTIRLLLGLLKPTSGFTMVMGYDSRYNSTEIRERTGVLLEDDALYSRLNIYRNLQFYGEINRIPQPLLNRKIEVSLKGMDLWDRRTEPVFHLSRGLRRKCALARALLHNPELLMLDEPTAGLDPSSIASIRESLRYLSTSGITVFLATHNLSEAERLCNSIGIINNGRLLRSGATMDLIARLHNPVVQITCNPVTQQICEMLIAMPGITSCSIHDGRLRVAMNNARFTSSIVRTLVDSGVSVDAVIPVTGNLEDYYLSTVDGISE